MKPAITYSTKDGYILHNAASDAPMNDWGKVVVLGKDLTPEQRELIKAAHRKLK